MGKSKENNYKLLQSDNNFNTYILVISPEVENIDEVINEVVGTVEFKRKVSLKMDLIQFLGNSDERFLTFKVRNKTILKGTIVKGKQDKESVEKTLEEYSKLNKEMINNKIKGEYREVVLGKKEELKL